MLLPQFLLDKRSLTPPRRALFGGVIHVSTESGIDMSLIPPPLGSEPVDDVLIEPEAELHFGLRRREGAHRSPKRFILTYVRDLFLFFLGPLRHDEITGDFALEDSARIFPFHGSWPFVKK